VGTGYKKCGLWGYLLVIGEWHIMYWDPGYSLREFRDDNLAFTGNSGMTILRSLRIPGWQSCVHWEFRD